MRQIILASTSPRRKKVLKTLIGENYKVIPSEYEEDNTLNLSPEELVKKHSIGKARDVAKKVTSGIVIASDCLVFLDGEVMGKPITPEKAKSDLKKLSGKVLETMSGLAVIDVDNNKEYIDYDLAKVKIKEMSDKEIEDYVKTGEPLDRSGSFAIQGKASIFIEKIDGDFFSIVGFPVFKLNKILNENGITIFDYK